MEFMPILLLLLLITSNFNSLPVQTPCANNIIKQSSMLRGTWFKDFIKCLVQLKGHLIVHDLRWGTIPASIITLHILAIWSSWVAMTWSCSAMICCDLTENFELFDTLDILSDLSDFRDFRDSWFTVFRRYLPLSAVRHGLVT